jgi:hypothetical protein
MQAILVLVVFINGKKEDEQKKEVPPCNLTAPLWIQRKYMDDLGTF